MRHMQIAAGALGMLAVAAVMAASGAALQEGRAMDPAYGASVQVEQPPAPPGGAAAMGRMLLESLKAAEGCLGADAAQWQSGKNTICAWFEDKAAVQRWYGSEIHARMMQGFGERPDPDEALRHVKDGEGPIMVMATLEFKGPPAVPESPIPFSMISIELFKPLPGGAYVKERLAPEGFEVPHMRKYEPEG